MSAKIIIPLVANAIVVYIITISFYIFIISNKLILIQGGIMKITLNHEEFLQYKYNKKSILSIKANKVLKNKLFKESALLIGSTTAILILKTNDCYAMADMTKIDVAGNMFLEIVKHAGYWIILLVAICNVIKTATATNNNSDIFKVIAKYILIYATLFILPWAFDLVEGVFK